MSVIDYEDIRTIAMEHTSRCNLQCPECPRTYKGGLNPNLKMRDTTLDDYKRIIPPDLCKQINLVVLCGCNGDAVASPTVTDCVEYLSENNVPMQIHTNGSLREKEWWKRLAEIMVPESKVVFAIDGTTHEINKINRVHSNFDMIMRNVKAFIDAGGSARWDFLDFEYNTHQLEDAKQLAKDMGFKVFNARKSKAFINNSHFRESFTENKYTGEDEHFKELLKKYGSWENYMNETNITCKVKTSKEIYVDHRLNLWPCTWVGGQYFSHSKNHLQKTQLNELYEKYGKGFNSLKYKTIKEILEHQWFKHDLEQSWKETFKNGKMAHCAKVCGDFFRPSTTESCNRHLTYFE